MLGELFEPRRRGEPAGISLLSAVVGLVVLGAIVAVSMLISAAATPEPPSGLDELERLRASTGAFEDRLAPGERFGDVLGRHGLGPIEAANLADLIRPFADPGRLEPGAELQITWGPTGGPSRIRVTLDLDRSVELVLRGALWTIELDSVAVVLDTVVLGGLVGSSLYAAQLTGDVDRVSDREIGWLAWNLSEIFAAQLDFFRDLQAGDAFRAAVEREVRPDGSVRSSRVLAAEFVNAGQRLTAIQYRPPEKTEAGYYDALGRTLRGAFLKAPLELVRVTSRFQRDRYHPVLGRRRPHLGVDYGARPGTPIRATGDGSVLRAGWWGDYGYMLEIQHADGMRTRYAHLRAFANDIGPGAKVAQGETIGYVGSTGLATGPHVHYELLRDGRPTDPTMLNLAAPEPISADEAVSFTLHRVRSVDLLDRVEWPIPDAVIAASRIGRRAANRTGD